MKLETKSVAEEILKIMDTEGLSAEEIANLSGISKVTIYRIINDRSGFTQRAIARKIAEGTGRTFEITGDKIKFFKSAKQNKDENLDDLDREIVEIIRKQDKKQKKQILIMIGALCKALETESES